MKLLLLATNLLILAPVLNAQSVDEGNQQLYYHKYKSAENSFLETLKRDPNNAAASWGLTKTALLSGNIQMADQQLRRSTADMQQQPLWEAAFGAILLAENKKDSATVYFQDALKRTKEKDPAVLSAIATAETETKTGDATYAVQLIEKAIKKDKRNPSLYVLLGNAYRKQGNSSEAYKAYKEAIDKNDKYAAAYYEIADIFLSQKNKDLYLENFNKAVEVDPAYAPALQRLYAYYFYTEPAKSLEFYNRYVAVADRSADADYDLVDLYYVNKMYDKAITKANEIISEQKNEAKPRLYKLIGYSYADKKDSATALNYMQQYFQQEVDSNLITKDFEMMADLYISKGANDSALAYYAKATSIEKDSTKLFATYRKLADMSEQMKDFASQAKWLGKYYPNNPKATNVDLFKWGLAYYRSEDFNMADSVFGMYVDKYPDQSYGYYWLAKANAAVDKDMAEGRAIPHYKKLIDVLNADQQNPNYKAWLVESYGYLAAYEANKEKDYPEAIGYFEKVLEVDPENSDAKKYISILEKSEAGK